MRSGVDSTTLNLYTSGNFDLHSRLKVANGSGTLINLSGRYIGYSLRLPNPNSPIASLRVDFIREMTKSGASDSLAPTVAASTLNRLNDGTTYSPLLQLGRKVTFEVALTAVGGARPADGATTWYEIFQGIITKVDWPENDSRQASIDCNDLGAILQHQKSETAYTYAAGTSLDTVARQILDNNGFTTVPLYIPVATGKVLPNAYAPGLQKPVWEQLWDLAQSMGWVVFYRYRGQSAPEVTLFEPARGKVSSDMTVNAYDFRALSVDETEVRNVGYLAYYDTTGAYTILGPFVNNPSITKYGGFRRPFWIGLEKESPVRTNAAATDMLNAALSDVADPDAIASALTFPLVFGESGVDLYTFTAHPRLFDSDQILAPFGITIEGKSGELPVTVVDVRGIPTAGGKTWSRYTGEPETTGMIEPSVSAVPTQSGLTGTIALTVKDPQKRVTKLEYQTKPPGGSFGAWTNWTGGTGVVGGDTTLTRSVNVTLDEKHNASIAWRVTYNDTLGTVHEIADAFTFDGDTEPNITAIAISFTSTGNVVVAPTGDEDTNGMYVSVNIGSAPADPTASVYTVFISGRVSAGVNTGVNCAEGSIAYVKVRGVDAYNSTLGSQVASAQLLRPTSGASTPREPLIRPEASQSGTTGTLSLSITDPDLKVTAIQYQTKVGEGAWGAWTNWTGGTGTPGSSTSLTRSVNVTIDEKHNSSIQWLITINRGAGSEYISGSHTFDINVMANVLSCSISFSSTGVVTVQPIGDEDTASMYVNVGNGSLPADPTSSAYHLFLSGARPAATSTGQTVSADTMAYVKVRGYAADASAGPVSTFTQYRAATPAGNNQVTDATLGGGTTGTSPNYCRPSYSATVIKETGNTVDITIEWTDSEGATGSDSIVSGGTANSYSGNYSSTLYQYNKPTGTDWVSFTLRVTINTGGTKKAYGLSNVMTYNYVIIV